MWLTLPGAAMCSIPIGIVFGPAVLAYFGLSLPVLSGFGGFALVLIPVTAITSRKAYKHSISTTGYPGLRMILMVFNFIARGLADLCIWFFIFVAIVIPLAATLGQLVGR